MLPRLCSAALALLLSTLALAVDVTLSVGASDDGLPNPPAALTYTWAVQSKPGGAADPAINQTGPTPGTGYTDTAVATFVSGAVPGVYTFRCTVSDGSLSTTSDATVTVQSAQSITFGALPSKQVGDADFPPGATASSGLTVSYNSSNPAVATIVSGQIHVVGAGTTTITASQAGNATYAAATNVSQVLTVTAAPSLLSQTITFPSLPTKQVTAADFAPGATASSGLTVSYNSSNPAVATIVSGQIHVVGVGTTTITASQSGNATYVAATNVSQVLTVTLASQTITFNALPSKQVGDADFAPGATASSGLTVSYVSSNPAVATIVSGQIHVVGVGTASIMASQAGNGTYAAAASVSQTLTVSSAPLLSQTITFTSLPTKVVTDADFSPGATTSSGLPVTYTSSNLAVATIVNGQIHLVGVGTSTIMASQAGNSTYAAATNAIQTLTVIQATQTITFNALPSKQVGDADFAPGATSSSGLPVAYTSSNLSVATIVSGQIHVVGAGTASIVASQAGNGTYAAAANVSQTLTVSATPLLSQTITFGSLPAKQMGDADFAPGATASSGLPVNYVSSNPSVATIVSGQIHVVGAGTATITASQVGDGTYAAAASVNQVLTVTSSQTALPVIGTASGTSTSTPVLQGTAIGGASLRIRDGGVLIGTATAAGDGTWTWTPTAPLAIGTHALTVTAQAAGALESAETAPVTVTVAPPAPTAPVATAQAGGGFLATGTGAVGATITVLVDGVTGPTTTVPANGVYTVTVGPQTDGSHAVTVTATVGGLVSPASAPTAVVTDGTAPSTPVIGSSTVLGTTVSLSGSAEAGGTVKLFVDGAPFATVVVNSAGAWSATLSGLSAGNHQVTAQTLDVTGNASGLSSGTVVTVVAVPDATGGASASGGGSGGGCGLGGGLALLLAAGLRSRRNRSLTSGPGH